MFLAGLGGGRMPPFAGPILTFCQFLLAKRQITRNY